MSDLLGRLLAMDSVDQLLDQIASKQHGLVTRRQAQEIGLTRRQIERRLGLGRLIVVQRGVFRVAGAPVTWRQQALAGCRAAPDGAVASMETAAALAGLAPTAPTPPHVTVPYGASNRADAV